MPSCTHTTPTQVKAGTPERLMELALLSVAHFEPVEVQVLIEGTYPMLAFNLPRVKDAAFTAALEAARGRCVLCGVQLSLVSLLY